MKVEIALTVFFIVIIGTLIYWNMNLYKEGFLNGSPAMPQGNSFAPACGVQYPTCPTGMKCINGFCGLPMQPKQPRSSGLPVIPMQSGGSWGKETLDGVRGFDPLMDLSIL